MILKSSTFLMLVKLPSKWPQSFPSPYGQFTVHAEGFTGNKFAKNCKKQNE